MTYKLQFDPRALKEWNKLGYTIKEALRKKLKEVLKSPHVEKSKLTGLPACYKIKLKADGYRLVYQVQDQALIVLVIAIGKREKDAAYKNAGVQSPATAGQKQGRGQSQFGFSN